MCLSLNALLIFFFLIIKKKISSLMGYTKVGSRGRFWPVDQPWFSNPCLRELGFHLHSPATLAESRCLFPSGWGQSPRASSHWTDLGHVLFLSHSEAGGLVLFGGWSVASIACVLRVGEQRWPKGKATLLLEYGGSGCGAGRDPRSTLQW